jgi:hypothetical protein
MYNTQRPYNKAVKMKTASSPQKTIKFSQANTKGEYGAEFYHPELERDFCEKRACNYAKQVRRRCKWANSLAPTNSHVEIRQPAANFCSLKSLLTTLQNGIKRPSDEPLTTLVRGLFKLDVYFCHLFKSHCRALKMKIHFILLTF